MGVRFAPLCAQALLLAGCDQLLHLDPVHDAGGPGATVDASPGTLIQQMAAGGHGTTSFQLDLKMPPTKGNTLVLIGSAETQLISSVSGGAASWTVVTRVTGHHNVEIWYGLVADAASSTVTIDCANCGTTTHPLWMWVGEWYGLATAAPVDGQSTATGTTTGTSNATVQLSTLNGPDLLVFGIASYSGLTVDIPGWTALDPISLPPDTTQYEWYQVAPSKGDFTAMTTVTSNWEAAAAAFRIAAP